MLIKKLSKREAVEKYIAGNKGIYGANTRIDKLKPETAISRIVNGAVNGLKVLVYVPESPLAQKCFLIDAEELHFEDVKVAAFKKFLSVLDDHPENQLHITITSGIKDAEFIAAPNGVKVKLCPMSKACVNGRYNFYEFIADGWE